MNILLGVFHRSSCFRHCFIVILIMDQLWRMMMASVVT